MFKGASIYKITLGISLACLAAVLVMLALGYRTEISIPLVAFFLFLAIAVRGVPSLRGISYTIMIFAAVTMAMFYPSYFVEVRGFQLKKLIVPLLQLIMFGMGTSMSLNDFAGVAKMPKGVLVGVFCH